MVTSITLVRWQRSQFYFFPFLLHFLFSIHLYNAVTSTCSYLWTWHSLGQLPNLFLSYRQSCQYFFSAPFPLLENNEAVHLAHHPSLLSISALFLLFLRPTLPLCILLASSSSHIFSAWLNPCSLPLTSLSQGHFRTATATFHPFSTPPRCTISQHIISVWIVLPLLQATISLRQGLCVLVHFCRAEHTEVLKQKEPGKYF